MDLVVNVLDVFQGREGGPLDLGEPLPVAVIPQEDGIGGLSVASGAARFLEIGLGAVGQVVMDHEPHVRFVDAHAEGVGTHHYPCPSGFPVLLAEGPDLRGNACMVERGGNAGGAEHPGGFFCPLPVAYIHDARPGDTAAHGKKLPVLVLALPDDIGEVGPLESGFEEILLPESEPVHDVVRDGGRRRGREGDHRRLHGSPQHTDLEVFRAEIVPPLRDAVRLVHDDEGDVQDGKVVLEQPGLDALGGDIQELVVAVGRVVQRQVHFAAVHPGMDGDGPDPPGSEVLDLVLHQGDEGCHHQREAVPHQGRNLETHGFPAAGREDGEDVAARERLLDDALLHGPESVIAPIGFQNLFRCHFLLNVPPFNCKYL